MFVYVIVAKELITWQIFSWALSLLQGDKNYILVAIDYVFKWEEIASRTNYARVVSMFSKRFIFPRFGMPRVLISNCGTYFIERKFEAMLTKYGVHHK